jgi:MAF protein
MGPLFSNGMVLQQQQNTNIWGWATADAKVTVKTSWGAKAKAVAETHPNENILSADTIIVVGQKIIQKSPDDATQTNVMKMLSGRTHRVITSVCLIDKSGHIAQRTVTTKITMKHLTEQEITDYIKQGEWHGVAGYKIEGMLAGYVKKISVHTRELSAYRCMKPKTF